ncbi:11931_t:CDS:2, partial [Dentiscutata erythropus]
MLEEANPNLKNFFANMYTILIPDNCSPYNKKDDKKKIGTILYLIVRICNKHANNFKLELALYLAESGVTCDAINMLSSTRLSVTHQTIYNYKKKIADEYSIRQDYLDALNIILNYNKEIGHLDGNIAPIIANWPGQRYIRQALTYFHNKNDTSISKEIVLFVSLLGLLHIALNTKEQ